MPKKTKKEKLLALYHKKLSLLENRSTSSPVPSVVRPQVQEEPKKNVHNPKEIVEEKHLNKYFKSDLRKSLVLIAIIIGIEISLYTTHLIK